MRHSLRVRLPLLISGLIAVSLIAFLSVAFQQVQRGLLGAGQARAEVAADQLANLLAQATQQQMTGVRGVAQDAAVRSYLQHPGDAAAESARQRLFTLISAGQPAVELWNDAGGRLLAVGPMKSDGPVPSLPASQQPSADGVGTFQASGQDVHWDVVAEVRAEPTDSPGVSPSPRGFVVSRRVLSRAANSDAIGKLVGPGAMIRLGNASGGVWSDLSKLVAPPIVEVRAGAIADGRTVDGERFVGYFAQVRGTPWIVLVGFPRSTVVAPARAFVLRMLVVVAFLVLAAAGAAHALSARITTPLGQLTHAAEAIAQGRFEERVHTGRRDEIGRLAIAFQTMATEVHSSRHQLETRVEERTQAIGELNTQLERRVSELKNLTGELEAFSYSVSHDLRAPLRHVHGYVEMLQRATDGQLSEQAQRYLKTISEASGEMGQLIDDLLAFSRMGRTEMRESRVDLGVLVQDTIRGLDMATKDRHIIWQTAPLPAVLGEVSMLKQVLANLVGNAVKYSRMRDPARIEIGCAGEEDGRVILFVRDNGAGFDMQYAHKLFGVFQRLHRAEEFEGTGTGIGLATVRRIVTRHGGRVWAEGAVNAGATFYLTLQPAVSS